MEVDLNSSFVGEDGCFLSNMDGAAKLYERLFLEKSSLKKECDWLALQYAREFGEEEERLFSLNVKTLEIKRKIEYCQRKDYMGEAIYEEELTHNVEEQMRKYYDEQKELSGYNQFAKIKREEISPRDVREIKSLYRDLIHLIHPDLHPEYCESEEMLILWDDATDAYKRNDLACLTKAYDTALFLIDGNSFSIREAERKIDALAKEIELIKAEEPYTFKYILCDDEKVALRHQKLRERIAEVEEYNRLLENRLARFSIITRRGQNG